MKDKPTGPLKPRSGINRRDFLKLSSAGLMGTALLGVGGALRVAAQEPIELVFSFGPDDSGSLQNLIDAFNQEFEGQIHVRWREMARDTDTYFRQVRSDFVAHAADIDVIGGDLIWTAEFAYNRWIEDLSRQFYNAYRPDDFLEAPMNSTAFRNRIWAVPWFTDAGMLYYRKDLLEKSGFKNPPATWEELKTMAKKVMEESGTRYGFVFQGQEYEGGVTNALEYIWSARGRVLTGNISIAGAPGMVVIDPNVIVVNSKDSAIGLNIARSMITDGVAPEAVTTFREQEAYQAFLAGDAVFMRNWSFVYSLITDAEQSATSREQVGVTKIPVAAAGNPSFSCLGGWNLMINAFSTKKEAAWTFIRFATDPERQKRRALEGSFLPTLRGLYDDPEILEAVPVVELGKEAIINSRVRAVSPFYSDVSPRIAQAFSRVLRGQVTGEEAVQTLQKELQTLIRTRR